jgi:hypothetical protein
MSYTSLNPAVDVLPVASSICRLKFFAKASGNGGGLDIALDYLHIHTKRE